MTRLNAPVPAQKIHAVMTDRDLTHTAKVVWAYVKAVADPQRIRPMAGVLGMAENTVWRSLTALEAKGLVRRVNGVWMAESTAESDEEPDWTWHYFNTGPDARARRDSALDAWEKREGR
jgi:hypothetical protein